MNRRSVTSVSSEVKSAGESRASCGGTGQAGGGGRHGRRHRQQASRFTDPDHPRSANPGKWINGRHDAGLRRRRRGAGPDASRSWRPARSVLAAAGQAATVLVPEVMKREEDGEKEKFAAFTDPSHLALEPSPVADALDELVCFISPARSDDAQWLAELGQISPQRRPIEYEVAFKTRRNNSHQPRVDRRHRFPGHSATEQIISDTFSARLDRDFIGGSGVDSIPRISASPSRSPAPTARRHVHARPRLPGTACAAARTRLPGRHAS